MHISKTDTNLILKISSGIDMWQCVKLQVAQGLLNKHTGCVAILIQPVEKNMLTSQTVDDMQISMIFLFIVLEL